LVEYEEVSMSDMAIGANFKYFLDSSGTGNTLYLGTIMEYGWGSGVDDVGLAREEEGEYSYVSVLGDFGYRWRFRSGFFLNLGVLGGTAFEMKDEGVLVNPPYTKSEYTEDVFLVAMLEFSVGMTF
jgi:hypothetical protein